VRLAGNCRGILPPRPEKSTGNAVFFHGSRGSVFRFRTCGTFDDSFNFDQTAITAECNT